MKKRHTMTVIANDEIAAETFELVLHNEKIAKEAKPGQFLHISVPGHTLRRPISIADVDHVKGAVTILFKVVGSGTNQLAALQMGEVIDVLGPNGSSYPFASLQKGETVLLIGGGIGVPPLYFLAKTLYEKEINVQCILGFQSKEYVFYEDQFAQIADVQIVTDDGSYGRKGLVTDMIAEVAPFKQYYSCGPMPMLRAVKEKLPHIEGYLSFEERMGCGIGACYACVIPTNDIAGYKKICSDGPVIRASEVNI